MDFAIVDTGGNRVGIGNGAGGRSTAFMHAVSNMFNPMADEDKIRKARERERVKEEWSRQIAERKQEEAKRKQKEEADDNALQRSGGWSLDGGKDYNVHADFRRGRRNKQSDPSSQQQHHQQQQQQYYHQPSDEPTPLAASSRMQAAVHGAQQYSDVPQPMQAWSSNVSHRLLLCCLEAITDH